MGKMVSKNKYASMYDFAMVIHQLLRSDRDVNLGCGGMTGEGKSTFTTLLQKIYSKIAGVPWTFNNMTWDRDEMMTWIDGKKGSKIVEGLREGQVAEYSPILPDELFHMFYRRNWWQDDQIEAIATFNMCRDRHLFVAGNIPNFWKLDGAFTERVRFYVYIPKRGIAWVFQQENNPFASDQWNQNENMRTFRKNRNPYGCPNFLFEIHFPDWDEREKKAYYRVRNRKRLKALEKKPKKNENVKYLKQRNDLIILLIKVGITQKDIASRLNVKPQTISYIVKKSKKQITSKGS